LVAAAAATLRATGAQHAVTLRGVAGEVGISPAAVYLHFAHREDLVDAAVRFLFAEMETALVAAAARHRAPRRRLRALLLAYAEFAEREPGAYAAMINDSSDEWARVPRELLPGISALVSMVELVGAARRDDGHPSDQTVALHLWAALHGHLQLRRAAPQLPWPTMAQTVDDLLSAI
jgi:AcrR family transcriptional regulator